MRAVIIPSLAYNQCVCVFDVFQGHLQAPGLQEWEHTRPSPQSPGLFPQAPWSQVSPLSDLWFYVCNNNKKKRNCSPTEAHSGTEYSVEKDVEQPPLSFRGVCLRVFAKDNVLIIKSRRNNRSDSTHWQGGGTLMSSSECWGINSSHVTLKAFRSMTRDGSVEVHLSPAPFVSFLSPCSCSINLYFKNLINLLLSDFNP